MDRDIVAPALPCPTGHAEIDLEHSLLLACVDRLNTVCRIPDSRCSCRDCLVRMQSECHADLGNLLGDLLMYLVDHFRTEETLMRSHGVARIAPDFCERHKEDHAAIALTIQELTASLDPLQTADLVRRLHRLLSYWLQDHIARHDAVLVRFFPTTAA
ncbi:MAG: hemerythrin domain-containing protein [Dechloromonas sp.]|jgi:hemerythrin-like metal-binding protein|nr:hemerythrin domain-containing protein [Dechloromonas sp.]